MEATAGVFAALSEAVVFLNHFKDLPDPRQPGKVIYPLDEVLLLCLLAVLAGAETFVDTALFGERKLDLLRRFRPFRDGWGYFCNPRCRQVPAVLRILRWHR
jgi:DDE_Tnp_1-associated